MIPWHLAPPALALLLCGACVSAPPAPPSAPTAAVPATATTPTPATTAPRRPEAAPVREVRDDYFGTTIVDPYRWMESDSPELSKWMKAQADHTRERLDALPFLVELRARVKALDNAAASVGTPTRRGKAIFYLSASPGTNDYKLFTREDGVAKERLLIDPEALSTPDKHLSIDYFAPSPDGRLVAYGLSQSGSEMSVLHVLEAGTGRVLPDTIDRTRYPSVSWRDARSFFYKRNRALPPDAPATERFIKGLVHLHEVGKDPETDAPILGYGLSPDVTVPEEDLPHVVAPLASSWLLGVVNHGVQPDLAIYAVPRSGLAGARTRWKKIVVPADEVVDYAVHGDDLYLLCHHGAPRFKLLRMSLVKPDLARAVTVIPESEAVLSYVRTGSDAVYVQTLEAGVGGLRRVPFTTGVPARVEMPAGASVASIGVTASEPGAFVDAASWTRAPQLLSYDAKTGKMADTGLAPPSPVVFTDIEASEVMAKSEDGVLVPLSILHRRSLPPDGKNPAWLRGYGAYGDVWDPWFTPTDLAWLERGGIIATCHPRGGGSSARRGTRRASSPPSRTRSATSSPARSASSTTGSPRPRTWPARGRAPAGSSSAALSRPGLTCSARPSSTWA